MTWPNKRRAQPRSYRRDRLTVLERAGYRCQIRGPQCLGVANIDDHIQPVSLGGSNDVSNRQAACKPCHDEKTSREAAAAAKAARAKGKRPVRKHPGLLSVLKGRPQGSLPGVCGVRNVRSGAVRVSPQIWIPGLLSAPVGS